MPSFSTLQILRILCSLNIMHTLFISLDSLRISLRVSHGISAELFPEVFWRMLQLILTRFISKLFQGLLWKVPGIYPVLAARFLQNFPQWILMQVFRNFLQEFLQGFLLSFHMGVVQKLLHVAFPAVIFTKLCPAVSREISPEVFRKLLPELLLKFLRVSPWV